MDVPVIPAQHAFHRHYDAKDTTQSHPSKVSDRAKSPRIIQAARCWTPIIILQGET
jgi:hypothetical protein